MQKTARIITFTGRPGSGKSTIIKSVLAACPQLRMFAGKSVTTRPVRQDDIKGEYLHVTPEKFAALKDRGEFLWTAEHSGYLFGTRKADVDRALRARKISVMTLVPDAAAMLLAYAGRDKVVSFFIHVPEDVLLTRMTSGRGDLRERALARIRETAAWTHSLDMVIVANGKDEVPCAMTATSAVLKALPKC